MTQAHESAKTKFIKTWEKYHGFPPRTFPLDDMTTAEINELIESEIAEHDTSKKDEKKT